MIKLCCIGICLFRPEYGAVSADPSQFPFRPFPFSSRSRPAISLLAYQISGAGDINPRCGIPVSSLRERPPKHWHRGFGLQLSVNRQLGEHSISTSELMLLRG